MEGDLEICIKENEETSKNITNGTSETTDSSSGPGEFPSKIIIEKKRTHT